MDPKKKSLQAWQRELDPETFRITRLGGTERAFSGCYHDCRTAGLYRCRCCQAPLFRSSTKYDSGSGWPSFWQPVSEDGILERTDTSHGMVRTEILCARCEAHLGHVFPDGPAPTGLRYCVNSASLLLEPGEDEAPS